MAIAELRCRMKRELLGAFNGPLEAEKIHAGPYKKAKEHADRVRISIRGNV